MKAINPISTATLEKMVSMMEDGYVKIDNSNGSFMPVSLEVIFENEKYRIISMAHYFEQNGDLMADPEMCFIHLKGMNSFIPSYYKQDNLGIEQESVLFKDGIIKGVRTRMQTSHTVFANMWLRNIKQQQNL